MGMSKVIVAGKEFDCDAKVVNWKESGWDSTAERCVIQTKECAGGITAYSDKAKNRRPNRYSFRPGLGKTLYPDLKAAQALVRMFTVHHDGCPNAKTCFQVLHDERGLSCHFIIDNDGTIYQCLDLALMGFQAGGFNAHSIGVELCNRGDAKKYPGYYDGKASRGPKRTTDTVKVHGHTYLAYNYTEVQFRAFQELARCLRYALPNMPIDYPKDPKNPGQQAWGEIPNPQAFSGYMGHYHQTLRKWDPGPFDFKKFCDGVRGEACFPVTTQKLEPGRCQAIPTDTDELKKQTDQLYALNEAAQGGFFPVGPWGQKRLWHGGVHLAKNKGEPVSSPFPGLIVAARMGPPGPLGSTNFALVRHDMSVGPESIRFYALYYHLDDERGDGAPEWMTESKTWNASAGGQVQLLEEPVQAGARIGRVGVAGPSHASGAQLHLQIFAREPFVEDVQRIGIPANIWTVLDGTLGGRFCELTEIIEVIDKNKDGTVEDKEVLDAFRGTSRDVFHNFAVLFQSEWYGTSESWVAALKTSRDFSSVKDAELSRYVDDQIKPNLWWDKPLAKHARLPTDGIVWHFHPVAFIKFINEKLLEAAADSDGIGKYDISDASITPDTVTDDREDEDGSSFASEKELKGIDVVVNEIPLEELVQGFQE